MPQKIIEVVGTSKEGSPAVLRPGWHNHQQHEADDERSAFLRHPAMGSIILLIRQPVWRLGLGK